MKHVVVSVAIVLGLTLPLPGLEAQATGSITGVVTTKAVGPRPIRVTMDQRVCGNELPDEAVVVDATGHLANAVVTLSGVKGGTAPASAGVMNEKCSFAPRVQVVRPNATIITSSKDPILHTTNAMTEGGKTLFNVAVPVPGIKIYEAVEHASRPRAAHLQHTPVDARLHHRHRRHGCRHRRGWQVHADRRAGGHLRATHLARVAERGGAEGHDHRGTAGLG